MILMKIGLLYLVVLSSRILGVRSAQDVDNEAFFDPNALPIDARRDFAEFGALAPRKMDRAITIVGDDFVLDGVHRLHILSGSLHYFRTPAVYWKDLLMKLKAAGLNSVSTYVEWSFHEPEERQYDFSGDRDLARFIRTAAEVGLYVLLRPGPYICAERDLGGLPYWLLGKYPDIKLRTTDTNFMNESKIWFDKLFEQVGPLLYGKGGPIILVQIENEYGSYSNDVAYMNASRDILAGHVQGHALLYTTDGSYESMFTAGSAKGALTTIDFGVGISKLGDVVKSLRKFMPHGPLMNSEFYPGWLTHWTEAFSRVNTAPVVNQLKNMLNLKFHVNFYVFFGGTNFEFTSGANYGDSYQPDITSYDYDAPLTEAGDPTEKYYAIRKALEQYFPDVKAIPLPFVHPKGSYGTVKLESVVELLSDEGRAQLATSNRFHSGTKLPTFEELRQRSGLLLYETNIVSKNSEGVLAQQLVIKKPRDRIYVYVDGVLTGTLSRMDKKYNNSFNANDNFTLSLLVENQGRINYGSKLHDFKGILGDVTLNNRSIVPGNWHITGFNLENVNKSRISEVHRETISSQLKSGPVMYEGHFKLQNNEPPRHTYLNTDGWGKGYIWVNGHNLGRHWPLAGPQITLFVPGAWLKAAPESNLVQILELEQPSPNLTIELIDHPIFTAKNKIK